MARGTGEPWMVIPALNLLVPVIGAYLELPAAVPLLGPLFVIIGKSGSTSCSLA